eukprot:SAG31_NODE_7959_length_1558_cov_1.024038_1_plen_62_part_10
MHLRMLFVCSRLCTRMFNLWNFAAAGCWLLLLAAGAAAAAVGWSWMSDIDNEFNCCYYHATR